MFAIAEIDGRPIITDDVIRHLCISGQLPGIVAEMVGLTVIAREALSRGVTVPDTALQEAADDFRRNAGLGNSEECQAFFDARGWRIEDFEAHLERSLIRAAVREEIVPRERVEDHFNEHRHDFRAFAVSQVSVKSLEKAREILAQIHEEEVQFADAARKFSQEEATAPGGGFVGFLRLSQFPPAIRGALHGVKVGDLLGPFEIPGGATIVRIEAIHEPVLDQATGDEIAERLFADWLDRKIEELDANMIPTTAVEVVTEGEAARAESGAEAN